MKLWISRFFCRGFNSSKCKTMLKLAVGRVKLLRNRREVVIRQMRRDIALLIQSGQHATARVRVEHVIREQNTMAANEFIELFCELVMARLAIISKQRECPADLKEGIASLIFAAPRCSDIPELSSIRDIFEKKYGKDFASAATDLRPNSGVNRTLIEKLSVRTPAGEIKLKVMKEIAKEYQLEWDTTESEMELLKPPEELIEGPRTFVSASSLPVKLPKQSIELNNSTTRSSDDEEINTRNFLDSASAAEAAAKSAVEAVAAAEAAAYLAYTDSYQTMRAELKTSAGIKRQSFGSHCLSGRETTMATEGINRRHSYNVPPVQQHTSSDETGCKEEIQFKGPGKELYPRASQPSSTDARKYYKRQSYNARTDIKFDESDCDEEIEMERPPSDISLPPNRPAPVPRGHPKLPDYDKLAAHFEALKGRKSQK